MKHKRSVIKTVKDADNYHRDNENISKKKDFCL